MTVHQLIPATRPAVVPMLFPRSLDGLLYNRKGAIHLAAYSVHETKQHFRFAAQQIAWANRLSARIAQVSV